MMSDFEKQPEKINLKEIWYKVLSNWKLLLAIFAIVITSTYLYLRYTTPMYEASVKIIIKDDENTTSGLSETSAFEDLKIMQFNNSIENEKSVINSRTIMGNVVDSLEIDIILKSTEFNKFLKEFSNVKSIKHNFEFKINLKIDMPKQKDMVYTSDILDFRSSRTL